MINIDEYDGYIIVKVNDDVTFGLMDDEISDVAEMLMSYAYDREQRLSAEAERLEVLAILAQE